jgi:type IV secretion system protein TrbE
MMMLTMFGKYKNSFRVVLDKDYSARPTILLQGGQYIDLAGRAGAKPQLNPLALLREGDTHKLWVTTWVEGLIQSNGYKLTTVTSDSEGITNAISDITQLFRDTGDLGVLQLGYLYEQLPVHLQGHLAPWVNIKEGKYAEVFDNPIDTFDMGDLVGIAMDSVFRDPELARAFLDYVFYRIQIKLAKPIGPSFIYLEECWFLLRDEVVALQVEDWLRTFRKKFAMVCLATQSLKELKDSTIFTVLAEQVPNRIFLPNKEAEQFSDFYKVNFRLTDDDIQTLVNAKPMRQYLMVQEEMKRLVWAEIPDVALAGLRSEKSAQTTLDKWLMSGQPYPQWAFSHIEEVLSVR